MNKQEIIKKLKELGWKEEYENGKTVLTSTWNMTETTAVGDYSHYDEKKIIDKIYIKYVLDIENEITNFIIFDSSQNISNCIPEDDDFEQVLELALKNELFLPANPPLFETIIEDSREFEEETYSLVKLVKDYENSLGQKYQSGQYFIKIVNNTNSPVYYYPIEINFANELQAISKDNAIIKMEEYVLLYC